MLASVNFKQLYETCGKDPDGVARIIDHSVQDYDGFDYVIEIRKVLATSMNTAYGTLAGS